MQHQKQQEEVERLINDYEQVILEPAIQESVKSVISKYTAEEVVTSRTEVSLKSLEELQNKVSKYGIVIDSFNIINLTFSEEYSNAIEEKQVAEQKLATAKLEAEAAAFNQQKLTLDSTSLFFGANEGTEE